MDGQLGEMPVAQPRFDLAKPASPIVRHFRQIVIWPLQLSFSGGGDPAGSSAQFERLGEKAWMLVEDEFGSRNQPLDERHYREFVSFLPHVQRFLYGDAPGPVRNLGYGDAPLRIYRRSDVASVRVQLRPDTEPVVCKMSHIDLHFFYDVDVVILACELETSNIPLATAQELLYRFGRAYPPGWSETGEPLHCPTRVEWLAGDGTVLAASDYDDRDRYLKFVGHSRSPCFAAHWEYLLRPLVSYASAEPGEMRFRQIEYYRMPVMAFATVDCLADIKRADLVRLAFASSPAERDDLPYSAHFLADFERDHCYDRFYHEGASGTGTNTRFLMCGHALTVIAEGEAGTIEDNERGLLGQFRHQYYLLFLICHFHKAAMLMLSDRLVAAVKRLEVKSARSATAFRLEVYRLQESFMRFTQRYWFSDVSDQAQARDLFRKQRTMLDNEQMYRELRSEIFDSVQYLDSDVLRRQTGSMHRLTAITIVGLIGTVVTGFLGMNLIAIAEQPLETKLLYFGIVSAVVTTLTIAVVTGSRSLTALFDRISGEK
jgi:hypothetical protein